MNEEELTEIKQLKLLSERDYHGLEQYIIIRYFSNDSIDIEWPFEEEILGFSPENTIKLLNFLTRGIR